MVFLILATAVVAAVEPVEPARPLAHQKQEMADPAELALLQEYQFYMPVAVAVVSILPPEVRILERFLPVIKELLVQEEVAQGHAMEHRLRGLETEVLLHSLDKKIVVAVAVDRDTMDQTDRVEVAMAALE